MLTCALDDRRRWMGAKAKAKADNGQPLATAGGSEGDDGVMLEDGHDGHTVRLAAVFTNASFHSSPLTRAHLTPTCLPIPILLI